MPILPLFLRRLWLLRRAPVRLASARFLSSRTIVTATSGNLEISKVATISLVATLILGATSSRVDDMSRLRSIGDLNRSSLLRTQILHCALHLLVKKAYSLKDERIAGSF